MIAHVADHSLVLEYENGRSESRLQSTCEATDISHPIEKAVDFSPDDLQVSPKFIRDCKLHVIVKIIHPERTSLNTKHFIDIRIGNQIGEVVIQVQFSHLNVVATDKMEHFRILA